MWWPGLHEKGAQLDLAEEALREFVSEVRVRAEEAGSVAWREGFALLRRALGRRRRSAAAGRYKACDLLRRARRGYANARLRRLEAFRTHPLPNDRRCASAFGFFSRLLDDALGGRARDAQAAQIAHAEAFGFDWPGRHHFHEHRGRPAAAWSSSAHGASSTRRIARHRHRTLPLENALRGPRTPSRETCLASVLFELGGAMGHVEVFRQLLGLDAAERPALFTEAAPCARPGPAGRSRAATSGGQPGRNCWAGFWQGDLLRRRRHARGPSRRTA